MQTAKQLYNSIISKIEGIYDTQETSSIAFILMEYFNISKQDYILDSKISDFGFRISYFIKRLQNKEPIQYVLNESWFYDRKFYVDKNVLIPRPETEELCQLIIEDNKCKDSKLKILDIGTGSGCIPITLDLELENVEVTSLDISDGAINVAKKNAKSLNSKVKFVQKDILNDSIDLSIFDVIVSNPPYVLESEKELMKHNVLDNEPHLALFIDDNNPLIFYIKIIELCVTYSIGQLYFEINEQYGLEIEKLMVTKGFKNVFIKKDMFGKDRIVTGIL